MTVIDTQAWLRKRKLAKLMKELQRAQDNLTHTINNSGADIESDNDVRQESK